MCAGAPGQGCPPFSLAGRHVRAVWFGKKPIVPITLEQTGAMCVIHMDAEITIAQALELKQLLVQALKEGKELRLDLEAATEMDITALQLMWAGAREAKKLGVEFRTVGRVPQEISAAAIEAGLEGFPGSAEVS